MSYFFFFNDPATTEIYTLSLHAALPISACCAGTAIPRATAALTSSCLTVSPIASAAVARSEEHTSELQSHNDLVCRLLLDKKKAVRSATVRGTRSFSSRAARTDHPNGST